MLAVMIPLLLVADVAVPNGTDTQHGPEVNYAVTTNFSRSAEQALPLYETTTGRARLSCRKKFSFVLACRLSNLTLRKSVPGNARPTFRRSTTKEYPFEIAYNISGDVPAQLLIVPQSMDVDSLNLIRSIAAQLNFGLSSDEIANATVTGRFRKRASTMYGECDAGIEFRRLWRETADVEGPRGPRLMFFGPAFAWDLIDANAVIEKTISFDTCQRKDDYAPNFEAAATREWDVSSSMQRVRIEESGFFEAVTVTNGKIIELHRRRVGSVFRETVAVRFESVTLAKERITDVPDGVVASVLINDRAHTNLV